MKRYNTRMYGALFENKEGNYVDYADVEPLLAESVALKTRADKVESALRNLIERIEFYSAMGEDDRPNIEQWEYTEGSSDMKRARDALAADAAKETDDG